MKDRKFKVTTNHKKVRITWDRKPHTKIKHSVKVYNRKKRIDFDLR